MSRHATIAAVTSALGQVIDTPLATAMPAITVHYSRPDPNLITGPTLFVFMYQAKPNPAARNLDLPTRDSSGVAKQRPFEALDLSYLFTFASNAPFDAQLMMGTVISALNANPTLSPQQIRDALDSSGNPLVGDDPEIPIAPVRFSPLGLSLDELSKVWSVFFQMPYELSIAYRASVVVVEADIPIRPAMPANEPGLSGGPLTFPVVNEVVAATGRFLPITVDTGVAILGLRLDGEITLVRFAALPDVEPDTASPGRVVSQLPTTGLRAGALELRVVNQVFNADPLAPIEEVASNAVSFVLHPVIRAVAFDAPTKLLTVDVAPEVADGQRVRVLLDQLEVDDPAVHAIDAESFAAPSAQVTFDLTMVASGPYAIRVNVGGATSLPERDPATRALVHTVTVP